MYIVNAWPIAQQLLQPLNAGICFARNARQKNKEVDAKLFRHDVMVALYDGVEEKRAELCLQKVCEEVHGRLILERLTRAPKTYRKSHVQVTFTLDNF